MNKKQITALVEEFVAEVGSKNGLSEDEARTLVGIALKRNREAILKCVIVPTFADFQEPAHAAS